MICAGTNCPAMKIRKRMFRPGNRSRAKAYAASPSRIRIPKTEMTVMRTLLPNRVAKSPCCHASTTFCQENDVGSWNGLATIASDFLKTLIVNHANGARMTRASAHSHTYETDLAKRE
ncbi:hypothetical protein GCM10025867_02180 [Frondihabitans sucicola]|uniref:Uncharacterized protein n=1 Tax=Frondihabitans sucicola TaxID=1268041 RepID=A0ABM8GHX5_9MICO|nr:hypothetical protein GCM10025867_02180 [Frondihabitans sucicola]